MSFRVELKDWEAARPTAAPLRYGVFMEEKYALPGIELDDLDAQCVHALAIDEAGTTVATGRLQPDDWNRLSSAIGRLNDAPILIDETPALTAMEVRSRARRIAKQFQGKLGLIIVDYLQLMQATAVGENRATEISEISRSLKALAKELDVPVIALSQLSRAVEQRNDRRPMMSDLRESGAIEQDADVILFIYREEVYSPDKEEAKGRAEVIIGKQRNGPIGRIDLTFLGRYTRFANFQDPNAF